MRSRPLGLLLLFLLLAASANGGIIFLFHYYRWASAPVTTCSTPGANPRLLFSNQPIEWANLGPTDRTQAHFITNGVDFVGMIYDPPDGTGSQTYAPFGSDEAPYPFTYTFRLDTLQSGEATYRSALTAVCTGEGPTTSVVVDWFASAAPFYYRWAYAPSVDCIDNGDSVMLLFASQPVAWKNLPGAAEFDIVYSTNGSEQATGPFPLPDGDGSTVYGALGASRPTYPVHYAVRLDTKLNGVARYQSFLVGTCEADGPGVSRVYNVPEAGTTSLAMTALGALAGVARRRRCAA